MKMFLAFLVCLLGAVAAHAQQIPLNCAPGTPCSSTGPYNTKTGDNLAVTGYKINEMTAQLFATAGIHHTALSTYPGVTCGGTVDSNAAVVSAFNAAASSGNIVDVDCSILVHTGLDSTKPIFVPSNLKVNFVGGGVFVVDNVCNGAFIFESTHDTTWFNTQVEYVGNFGIAGGIDTNNAPCLDVQNNLNDVTITNYMANTGLNTFASGIHALWPGPTNRSAIFQVEGNVQRLFFTGRGRIYVPQTANAGQYIPVVMAFGIQWSNGLAVTGSTVSSLATTQEPIHVILDGLDYDGFYMGNVGAGSITFSNSTAHRYSDLQDGTTGTVALSGTLASGSTHGTLSTSAFPSGWSYPTGSYDLGIPIGTTTAATGSGGVATVTFTGGGVFPVGSVVRIDNILPVGYGGAYIVTASSAGSVSFQDANSGAAQTQAGTISQVVATPMTQGSTVTGTFSHATIAASTSATLYSGNVGGVWDWFAPPHWVYMDSGTGFDSTISVRFYDLIDFGIANFPTGYRRSITNSGPIDSIKLDVGNNADVNNIVTARVEGCADILSYGNPNGTISHWNCAFNSSTVAINTNSTNPSYGFRFPSNNYFFNINMNDIDVYDLATTPTGFGWLTLGCQQCSLTNIRVYANDYPLGATWSPGFQFNGSHIKFDGEVHFGQMGSTQYSRGVMANEGGGPAASLFNSDIKVTTFGWRKFPATFTAAPTGTSGTITSWPYNNNSNAILTFSDNEQRYGSVSGTTVTWSPALTGTPTTALLVGNSVNSNYSQYKNQVLVAQGGTNINNNIEIVDVDNGLDEKIENGLETDYFTQSWTGTPTGSSFTTPINFPGYCNIDRQDYGVYSNLTGPTSVNVGWSGATTALLTGQNTTTATNAGTPLTAPISLGGTARTILLTPVGGNFSTGTLGYMARCVSMYSVQ